MHKSGAEMETTGWVMASQSVDLIHWRAMTDLCRFPPEARHASVVPVSHHVLAQLRDASEQRP